MWRKIKALFIEHRRLYRLETEWRNMVEGPLWNTEAALASNIVVIAAAGAAASAASAAATAASAAACPSCH
jgi:hypothetical protein